MFFEQYSHEPYLAVARYWWTIAPGGREKKTKEFDNWRKLGYQALNIMEQHLATNRFFIGDHYSIADIALYAYTHVANEGTFNLSAYKEINNWLLRVRKQNDHVPMSWRPSNKSSAKY
jgi:glutathione S-transferase